MKLLLIDSRIKDYQIFIDSRQTDVDFLVFDYLSDTYNSIVEGLKSKGQQFTDIAVVQHADLIQGINILANEVRCITSEESPYPSFDTFRDFLINLKNEVGLVRFDMLGCALYDPIVMPSIFTYLESATGVDLRASTNFTGNAPDGDWILESDNVDVRDTYFTEAISAWTGVLYTYTNNSMYGANKMTKDVNGNFIYLHKDIYGRPINPPNDICGGNIKFPSSTIVTWGDVSRGGSGAPSGSNYVAICSNMYAFAALRSDGSIAAWGNSSFGGTGAPIGSDFVSIYSNETAFAALRNNGSISGWGGWGASTVSGYVAIYSTLSAFAALKNDGSILAWGDISNGGTGSPAGTGFVSIHSTNTAFAALKNDGTISAWGNTSNGGSGAPSLLEAGYTSIYSNTVAFAALHSSSSIVTWGLAGSGGSGGPSGTGFVSIYSTDTAFAALKNDGTISAWGNTTNGGSGAPTASGYVTIYSTKSAFAALKNDGSIFAWGLSGSGGIGAPTGTGFVSIYSTDTAFAALKNDGSISVWGNTTNGGSGGPSGTGYTAIFSTESAFSALKNDGSIVTWGNTLGGNSGSPTDDGYLAIYSTSLSFAALKPAASFNIDDYYHTTGASKQAETTIIQRSNTTSVWLAAHDISNMTISGAASIPDISSWNTLTSSSINFRAGSRPGGPAATMYPRYIVNGLNGMPIVNLSGGSNLTNANNFTMGAITYVIVFRINTMPVTTDHYGIIGCNTMNSAGRFLTVKNSKITVWYTGYSVDTTIAVTAGQWYILVSSYYAWQKAIVTLNGTLNTVTNNTANNPNSNTYGIQIGAMFGTANTSMDVAEAMVIPWAIDQDHITKIEGYLATKWGLLGSLPATHIYKSGYLTFTRPEPPSSLVAKGISGGITVTFNNIADGGSAITNNFITCSGVTVATTATSYTFTGLINGTSYRINVKSRNVYGDSSASFVIGTPDANITLPTDLCGAIVWYDSTNSSLINLDSASNATSLVNALDSNHYNMTLNGGTVTSTLNGVDSSIFFSVSGEFGNIPDLSLGRPTKYVVGMVFSTPSSNRSLWGGDDGGWDRGQAYSTTGAFGNGSTGNGNPLGGIRVELMKNIAINTKYIYVAVLNADIGAQIRVDGSGSSISGGPLIFKESSNAVSCGNFMFNRGSMTNYDGSAVNLHELVILQGTSWSMNDVFKLEGYFASKWALKSKLPTNHPYKSSVATIPNNIPNAPTAPVYSPQNGQISVAFTAPTNTGNNANSYYVLYNETNFSYVTNTASPIVMTGLTNGTTYNFSLFAVSVNNALSSALAIDNYVPSTTPDAPILNSITPGNTQAVINFTAPSNGGSAITGYKLSINNGISNESIGNVTSPYTRTGLLNGTTYTVLLIATNARGDSAASNTLTVTPYTVPTAPTIGTPTPGNGTASVPFTANSNGGSTILDYTVTSLDSSGATTNTVGTSSPINVLSLTNGRSYTFTVTARNAAGNSSSSSASVAVVPRTVPGAPTIGTATGGLATRRIDVSFGVPSNNGGSVITNYTVTSLDSSGATTNTTGTSSPIQVTNLTNGRSYTFTVVANNVAGSSAPSAPSNSAIPFTVPGTPTLNTVTAGAVTRQIVVNFTAPTTDGSNNITEYRAISNVAGLSGNITTGLPALGGSANITVGGLTNGTSYTFTVIAINAAGNSGSSNTSASIAPYTTPGQPTNLSSTPGNGQATITFTAPTTDGSNNITEYKALSTVGNLSGIITSLLPALGATGNILVTGLTNGTSYTFNVIAKNAAGSTTSASTTTVTPRTTPDVPTNLTTISGNLQAFISFTAPYDGGSTITQYTFTSSPDNIVRTGTSNPFTFTGLTAGRSYTFTMTATNAAGTSGSSSASTAVIPFSVPSAPTSVTGTPGNTSVSVSFVAPDNSGYLSIIDYTVTSLDSSGATTNTVGTSSPINVISLTNGRSYTFRVTGRNAVGSSAQSSASAAIVPRTVPSTPSISSTISGYNQATINFTPPSNGGSTITGYIFTSYINGVAQTPTKTGTGSPYIYTGLTAGTAYTFTIIATNAAGNSLESAQSTPAVTPYTVPGTPIINSITPGNTQAVINYSAPASNGGAGITGYFLSTNGGSSFTNIGSTAGSYTITSLTNGVLYNIQLKATNAAGDSGVATTTVTPRTVPGAPIIGTATAGIAQATITFTAPSTDGSSNILSYIATSTPGNITGTITNGLPALGATGSITVTGLTNGTTYSFTVVATNVAGSSVASSLSNQITPFTFPDQPTLVSVTQTNTPAIVSFTPPVNNGGSSIISYTVTSYINGSTPSIKAVGSSSPIVVSGLTNGVTYTFKVAASNAGGTSSESSASNSIVYNYTNNMSITNLSVKSADSCVLLSWTEDSRATGYYIYIDGQLVDSISGSQIIGRMSKQYYIDSGNSHNEDIQGNINGYVHYYSILPFNAYGFGLKTDDYYIMPFNAYDNINFTMLPKFTPLSLTNIVAWYDTAEKNNVIRDWGGGVLRINNKVSSNYPLVATTSPKPTYRNGYTGTSNSYDPDYVYSTDRTSGTYVYCIPNSYFTAQNLDISRTNTANSNVVIAIVYTSRNTSEKALWGTIAGTNNRYQFINSATSPTTNGSSAVNVGSILNTTSPTLYVGIYNTSTNSQVRVNGIPQITFTEITTNGTPIKPFQINADGSGGRIGEMLLHESIILQGSSWTMRDVYMLEGYLASKWNLSLNLPTSHPYKYVKPTVENNITSTIINNYIEYEPSYSSSTVVWYDSSMVDAHTIVNNYVTSIKNNILSSTYNMSITGTATYSKTASNSFIQFNTSSYGTITGLLLSRPTKYVVAIVYDTSTANQALWSTDNNGWDRLQGIGNIFSGSFTYGNGSNGGVSFSDITSTTNTKTLYVGVLTAGENSQIRINGLELRVTSSPTGLRSFTEDSTYQSSAPFTFNANQGSNSGNIKLHELVILEGDKWTSDEVNKLESYLGNKWGIKSSFPYKHPYKYIPAIVYGSVKQPSSPSFISASSTTNSITILFNAASSNDGLPLTYVLADINSNNAVLSSTNPITLTGLTANTSYTMYLYAIDSTNISSRYVTITESTKAA